MKSLPAPRIASLPAAAPSIGAPRPFQASQAKPAASASASGAVTHQLAGIDFAPPGPSAPVIQLNGKGNKKQKKQKAAAEAKKKKAQSQADRNAYNAVRYETTSKKNVGAKQAAAKQYKGNLAHGKGDKSKGKQGKTKKELDKINKKLRQQELDKKLDRWRRRDGDDDDNASSSHAIMV